MVTRAYLTAGSLHFPMVPECLDSGIQVSVAPSVHLIPGSYIEEHEVPAPGQLSLYHALLEVWTAGTYM